MDVRQLVASIVQFLTRQLEDGGLTADSRESLEVAIQCLESAYNVQASDAPPDTFLTIGGGGGGGSSRVVNETPTLGPQATAEQKAEAERLKNEGNDLVKAEKLHEALANYTQAIQLDGHNAVYYCNRAAVHSKMGNFNSVISDCKIALSIDQFYSKAYGRMGLAYSSLQNYKEAKECFQKALEMEPDNESYRNNLQLAEEKIAQQGLGSLGLGGSLSNVDLGQILRNPALMQMARQMLTDPNMQNVMSNIISASGAQGDRIEALIEAGQQLAQQMESANPDLIESLRRQMGGNSNDPDPNTN
ncbi:small glutamine-rich tetratricopeptide repeat-containing protein alpha-like [Leptopilina heterotoma]|uniref:small glutamine-rich tetratricopeptide repeat-containing protein alpha-like n=1 Tax=Leptopilina heterotoma TaxID=63436 RepID=UPI001CA9C833|nr:small glutamine-rich tetratricopeptide repeat-containing protein alpha-like [Leptopilina heterotoma]